MKGFTAPGGAEHGSPYGSGGAGIGEGRAIVAYIECPACRRSIYAVARHHSVAFRCPHCDAALHDDDDRSFDATQVEGVVRRWRLTELRASARRKIARDENAPSP